jgi:hypothetical protein
MRQISPGPVKLNFARTLRAHRNKVVVAIANKLARIAWAVLAKGQDYRVGTVAAMA